MNEKTDWNELMNRKIGYGCFWAQTTEEDVRMWKTLGKTFRNCIFDK